MLENAWSVMNFQQEEKKSCGGCSSLNRMYIYYLYAGSFMEKDNITDKI